MFELLLEKAVNCFASFSKRRIMDYQEISGSSKQSNMLWAAQTLKSDYLNEVNASIVRRTQFLLDLCKQNGQFVNIKVAIDRRVCRNVSISIKEQQCRWSEHLEALS